MTKPAKPVISQSPVPPPQRGGEPRAIFATKANNYILWQINALYPYNAATVDYMDAAMDYTALQVDEAQAQASIATAQADIATQQAEIALGASNYKGLWADLSGPLSKPASVGHDGQIWVLNNDLADVTTSEPSDSNPDWYSYLSTGRTAKPELSSESITVNEYDTAQITITNYSDLLDYIITNNDQAKITVSVVNDKINVEALETTQSQAATFTIQAQYTGILEPSSFVLVTVSIIDIPIEPDTAIQIVDFSGLIDYTDGFTEV